MVYQRNRLVSASLTMDKSNDDQQVTDVETVSCRIKARVDRLWLVGEHLANCWTI